MGPASCLRPRAPRYAPSRFKVDALAGFMHAHAPSWYPKDTDPTEKSHLYEAEAAVLVSKHVVVRRLLDKEKDTMVPLPFANNARAGLFVNELMNYARTNREGSSARHLFVQAPKLSEADGRETTPIDESVYSRNRSFHLLFQSKFAKNRRLELDEASGKRFFRYWRPHPTVALLETMATFCATENRTLPTRSDTRGLRAHGCKILASSACRPGSRTRFRGQSSSHSAGSSPQLLGANLGLRSSR